MVQLSHPYMTTGKTIALARWMFVGKVMSLLFNMLSRFVIAFLPKLFFHLLIFSLYSCYLLVTSASVTSISFLSFILPIFAWIFPLVSLIFIKVSLVFHILFFPSISLNCLLRKAFYLSLLFFGILHSDGGIFPFLLCLSFLFSQLCVKPPQTTILPFNISFSWGWSWSLPLVQYHKPLSIVLQALCLSDLILWIYLSLPQYNYKVFDFFQFKSEFCNKEFMIWATVSSQSCFCWLYRASPSSAAKNKINLIKYWQSSDVHV